MKKFVVKLILFSLPVILFELIAEHLLTSSLKTSQKNYYAIWNDLFDGKINSDIIILGSSRAKININPKIIEDSTGLSTYNLGINGYNFDMDYLRYSLLMKYNKHPKFIILSLGYITLDKRKNLFMIEQFLPYTFDRDIYSTIKTYKGFNYYDYNMPFVRYIGKAKVIKHSLNIMHNPSANFTRRYKGYAGQMIDWNNELNKELTSAKRVIQHTDTNTVFLFDKFLQELKKENIKIVLVYSPEYYEAQKIYSNRKEIFSLFHRFAEKYNIPFLDYSNDEISKHKSNFYNSGHLNTRGADIFTKKLINDLKVKNCLHL